MPLFRRTDILILQAQPVLLVFLGYFLRHLPFFHYSGIYSFHDRCGERRFLVSVGGRYDWGIGYVGNWSFYFPAGIDAEEEVVYEV